MDVLKINDKSFTIEELIQKIKKNGWNTIVKPLMINMIVDNYAVTNKLMVKDEELQERFDSFRIQHGLYSAEDTERWLTGSGISLEDLEKDLEVQLLIETIKKSTPREAVEQFFAENKVKMDGAELSKLTVEEQEVAAELLAQLTEDEADFMILARDYSIDDHSKYGGYIGVVQRGNLSDQLAPQVFGAQVGEVLGPYPSEEGFYLLRVNQFRPAVLDEQQEKEIRDILFERFLNDQIKNLQVSWSF